MSVHLHCMYLFFPFLETTLQLICKNEDTHLNSSPPASSVQLYKFPPLISSILWEGDSLCK